MLNHDEVMKAFADWYYGLRQYGRFPAKGTISGTLVVLESLKADYNLNIDAHTAEGGSQIQGASGMAVRRILMTFGEARPFVSEGGRTNRGLRGDIMSMLRVLQGTQLESVSPEERAFVLQELQGFLVDRVRDFHNQQRLSVPYNSKQTTRQWVRQLLTSARAVGKEGAVAQYIIGAKLQIRFPDLLVENHSYSTADAPSGRTGDFQVGDVVFHVTIAPMAPVFEKCQKNIQDGLRAYLLVPDDRLIGARQNAEGMAEGEIAVESIESFVAQNIDELSQFSRRELRLKLVELIAVYNRRVDEVEFDKSMMLELPLALQD